MSLTRYTTITLVFFLLLCQLSTSSFGQLGMTFNVKKPKEFENRVLRSEKSDQKKFTVPKRFIQNTITHYNYFFNANNKLNDVLTRAKEAFKDDYSKLIPFYNYSLDVTAMDSIQLDSIVSKAQTGIILHDLRSDWADNMYLLWGASYYLQKQFDSAYLMFQFINYAFADKEKDGYYRAIGSARDGNSALSISTKEKAGLTRKIFSEPPSRNDAFIWQIRNHLVQNQYAQAATLVLALRNDPVFPSRLKNDLEEVQAYYFYRQGMWDSTAFHLENALSNATNSQEKSRWEYLIGQLYEKTNKFTEAENWYAKSIVHTTDPIMDIYARLALVRVNKDGGENYIDKNVATLVKMARRDKYSDYRDIVYYMAAQMELERNNTDGALALLLKSTKYIANNPSQRNKAFLQLAELSFGKRQYRQSYNFYDSLRLDDTALTNQEDILARKLILAKLADNLEIINRQDSLQRLASLPEEERKGLVRKLVRQLRRQQGLKDEGATPGGNTTGSSFVPETPPSLFADNSKKGEWYFYNTSSRQRGNSEFKSRWGTRANTDNWRRSVAQAANLQARTNDVAGLSTINTGTAPPEPTEITYDALYGNIPMSEDKMKLSNDSIQSALFTLGVIYVQSLEDCESGTAALEELRTRFPKHPNMDEALFNLYYCYNKNNETVKAAEIKKLMSDKFPGSNFTTIATTGKNPRASGSRSEATATYEKIYNLFIEGNFEEAITSKHAADSIYGKNYWTPQLLYIEAVYYIKQKQDSAAKTVLNNIISQFANTPLAAKATTMLDVLSRRAQIEEELRNMVINMPAEDSSRTGELIVKAPPVTMPVTQAPVTVDSAGLKPPVQAPPVAVIPKPKTDTVVTKAPPPPLAYDFAPETPQYVVLLLNKVDPIFVNEAKNAFARYNRDTYYNKQMDAELVDIDAENRLLLISPFKNVADAVAYIDQTKPKVASEIIPWLTGGKYSFLIITARNLELLKNSKDIKKYKDYIDQNLPGKF